ncbi:MAG: peptidoglycan DD-metalloendopeptidase family protein [Bacteroidetes bacterium]|nr:peptidoglycan DD-metalloendopeptidase family protein [Bacteroidota bacterium]
MCRKITDLKFPTIMSVCNKMHGFRLLLLLLLLPTLLLAQSKKELEEKRKKIIRDINTTERMIKKTAQTREATYDKYVALQSQIQNRETLIRTIQEEVEAAEESIVRNQDVIASLEKDIEQMQQEYGKMVRNAFRRKSLSNPLLYILSAESLNQAFRRWLFLRKYDRFRKQQADAIAATREMLAQKIRSINETRLEKESLLGSIQNQKATLSNELLQKDETLKFLSKDEERLKQDLQKKQVAHEQLNQAIENIIQEEVRKRAEEARRAPPVAAAPAKPEKTPTPSTPAPQPATKAPQPAVTAAPANAKPEAAEDMQSFDFRRNKGRLPWPVESGFISRGFGKQQHPTIKNISITNNGIDIRTEESAAVRAIHEGVVAGVQFIPGHDYTVILQHGDYYTVYTNLAETSLTKGETVRAKQVMGKVSTNAITGASELHFELWHQKDRINPVGWIKK